MNHGRRPAALVAAFITVTLMVVSVLARSAGAHEPGMSAVMLHLDDTEVVAELQLPVDRLDVVVEADLAAAGSALISRHGEMLRHHVAQRVGVNSVDGDAWDVTVGVPVLVVVDGVDHVVLKVILTPGRGAVTAFDLHYDVIVDHLLSHRVLVTAGPPTGEQEVVGMIDYSSKVIAVDPAGDRTPMLETVGLGFAHVSEGVDHLLFLVVLLLPAPLAASDGRWQRRSTTGWWPSLRRVLQVATAFTVGHSLTLAASALGWLLVPSQPVEVLVAVSIAVGAVHAFRPIFAHGEAMIAGGFGLVHGLAFAGILDHLDLASGATLTSLVGFNLGVEVAQLVTVVLVFPSLFLLSSRPIYARLRVGIALVAVFASVGWLVDRTGRAANPLEPAEQWLVAHPLVPAAVLAVAAIVSLRRSQVTLSSLTG